MRRNDSVWILTIVLGTVFFGGGTGEAAVDTYAYDPVHSSIGFKVQHLGISWIHGRFNEANGVFSLDREHPSNSTFKLTIKVDSVDTADKARDEHLLQADYFDAKQFPTIEFKSTSTKAVEDGYQVTGNFTMHGKTKKITFVLKGGREREFKGTRHVGFSTNLSLKRSDYDFDKRTIGLIGDEAVIFIDCEGVQK